MTKANTLSQKLINISKTMIAVYLASLVTTFAMLGGNWTQEFVRSFFSLTYLIRLVPLMAPLRIASLSTAALSTALAVRMKR